jgi:signal transduction histidine kinase
MSGILKTWIQRISAHIAGFFRFIYVRISTRLSTRLLFTLTIVSALPLIVVGVFMTSVTRESLLEYVKSQHVEIARRANNEIKLFLEKPIRTLQILTETQDITEMNPFAQGLMLNKISISDEIFNRIFIADTLGNLITSTDFEQQEVNYQQQEFFKQAISGSDYFSKVLFNEAKEPYVISSMPIQRFDEITGVLVGEINLTIIWDLVDEIMVGETGSAFVISRSGQLIAHPDKKKVLDRVQVIDPAVMTSFMDSVETSAIFSSLENTAMLGTFSYLRAFEWIVVIQQPIDEAYDVATQMLYQVFAFVALVIIIAVLLSYLLEKRITQPINALVDGVKRYAEGNLDYRISIEKFEEIAVLAEEFNAMAEKILDHQRKLRRVERLAAMSKFATLVSHEIRNPLNSMNINMQILKRELEHPNGNLEKKKKYYDIIVSEIQRMDNLINNFLMISRPPRFDFLPNDLHDVLNEVVLTHEGNLKQQNVRLVRDYCGKKILANVDRDQMKQVFHNIIINALQAMPDGGMLTLKTSPQKMRNRQKQKVDALRIEIIDTGVGIPKDKINDIFEFYYTSKKTGTGLGLAIAKQIVDGHFGTITVQSKESEFTKLSIDIPIKSQSVGIKTNQTKILEPA